MSSKNWYYYLAKFLFISLLLYFKMPTVNAQENHWEIPVYFVSDRISMQHRFDKQSFEQTITGQHIRFGCLWVDTKSADNIAKNPEFIQKLKWKKITNHTDKSDTIESQFHKTPEAYMAYSSSKNKQSLLNSNIDFMNDFISNFQEYVSLCPDQKFILFVHGCCLSLNETFETAGQLAMSTKLPVMIFDWATPGRLQVPILPEINAYRKSERALEISYHNFHDFITFLTPNIQNLKCVMIGHSMGNRIIYNELLRREDNKQLHFDQIHWIAADKSLPAFLLEQNVICEFARKVYVYTDKSDPWLKFSQILSSDVPRLGCSSEFLDFSQNFNDLYLDYPDNRYFLDVDSLKLKHNLPFALINDLIHHDIDQIKKFEFIITSPKLGNHVLTVKTVNH